MNRLRLDSVEWKEFKFNKIFKKIQRGRRLTKDNQMDGCIPYISSTSMNNGVDNFIANEDNVRIFEGCLTVANSGSVGACFYHCYKFIASDHVTSLKLNKANKHIYIFMSTIVKRLEEKYSFNREINDERIQQEKILLPIDSNGNPNWEFMEGYVKQEQKLQAQKIIDYYEQRIIECGFELLGFEDVEWKNFYVEDLFDFKQKPSKGLNHLTELDKGGVNYLGATNRNNGVISYVTSDEKLEYDGNCIAFIRNGEGSMGYSVYKKEKFLATQDISVGYNENLDKYIGLFITTIADKVRGKYNFGYKRNLQRLKKEVLRLPVDKDGKPHYEYMRKFMHKLENENISKVLEYIYIYIYIYRLAISMEQERYSLSGINMHWEEFWLEDIVDIKSGVRLTKADQTAGKIPFVGSSDGNNGVTAFVSNVNSSLDSNLLGVNYNGSVVDNFYHPYECIFSDDVKRLHFKEKAAMNKYCYLFLKQSILKQKCKYAYGYKFNAARMKRQKIMLPITANGKVDYSIMKKYMVIKEVKELYKVIKYFV